MNDHVLLKVEGDKLPLPTVLAECFFRGAAAGRMGGTSDSRWSLGHMRLTFAAMQVLCVHRFPMTPERFALGSTNKAPNGFLMAAKAMCDTPEELWAQLRDAIANLYPAQQAMLARHYPSGFVRLQRRVKLHESKRFEPWMLRQECSVDEYLDAKDADEYGAMLATAILKARGEPEKRFELETDVITGWCKADPGPYGEMLIVRDVPIQDVLFAAPYFEGVARHGLESDEWLVINRHPAGLMTIDADLCEVPAEIVRVFSERAQNTAWSRLKDAALSGMHERVRIWRMPGLSLKWQPVWYVRWAMRVAGWLGHGARA